MEKSAAGKAVHVSDQLDLVLHFLPTAPPLPQTSNLVSPQVCSPPAHPRDWQNGLFLRCSTAMPIRAGGRRQTHLRLPPCPQPLSSNPAPRDTARSQKPRSRAIRESHKRPAI